MVMHYLLIYLLKLALTKSMVAIIIGEFCLYIFSYFGIKHQEYLQNYIMKNIIYTCQQEFRFQKIKRFLQT